MKSIFKLSWVSLVYEKLVFLVVLLAVCLPFVMAELTHYQVDNAILEPARAQVAWQFAWLASFLWLTYEAAKLGSGHVMRGMGVYFKSKGVHQGEQLCALWLAPFIICVVLAMCAFAVSLLGAIPSDVQEARHWKLLGVQHLAFIIVVVSPLLMLAVSLGSRFGLTVGYVFTAALSFVGFYGVSIIETIVRFNDSFSLDLLYVILPHYYLGDLTHRFIHKQGALSLEEFFVVFEYLSGWAIVVSMVATVLFNYKKR
ncbi:hypothetical protein [Rubritalea marina]|uniref:hypothetical protein n=1 Tax=Rubritalea marina TaxID=361055 RepID=UPI0003730765|nr:hypothetical protein [Rubritalea marina]